VAAGRASQRLHGLRGAQARAHLAAGRAAWAACCQLSVGDASGAVHLLLRGREPELAAALACAQPDVALRRLGLAIFINRAEQVRRNRGGFSLVARAAEQSRAKPEPS
jgi:hypothetical protein